MTTEIEATYRDFCLWFNKQRAAGQISPAADRAADFIKLGLWALAYNGNPAALDPSAGSRATLKNTRTRTPSAKCRQSAHRVK